MEESISQRSPENTAPNSPTPKPIPRCIFAPMHMTIDIGNTRVKIAVFEGPDMMVFRAIDREAFGQVVLEMRATYPISRAIYAHSGPDMTLSEKEALAGVSLVQLTPTLRLPFAVSYDTPETLGMDRVALAAGALSEFPGETVLVVSLGTCVTYELMTNNSYCGGGISPGLQMRLRALADYTHALPWLKENQTPLATEGKNTQQSIQHGTIWGWKQEILGVINKYQLRFGNIKIIITGGDAHFFDDCIKSHIFARPNLNAIGLNFILRHHAH